MEWTLAWRYFRSKRTHPFIGLISNISVVAVALGVAALIVVLAVMNGFDRDLQDRIVGTYAHAVVDASAPFVAEEALLAKIEATSEALEATAPFIQAQVLIQKDKFIEGVLLKGSRETSETKVSSIASYITGGRYPAEGGREIMMGDVLARRLGVGVGDKLSVISPITRKPTPVTLAGIYHSGMYEYDAHLAYAPLDLAQEWLGLKNEVTGIAVRYSDAEAAIRHKRGLQQSLGYPFYVRTWADMNQTLFEALRLEKTVMFLILTLIVLVACFNIVGTLTLLVMDKTKDIGILKALGATRAQITRIFTMNGLIIGASGTFLGVAIGLGLSFLLDRYPIIQIPSDIYYFQELPVHLIGRDILAIVLCSLFLSLLSTLYPARAGAGLDPVEALKYE